jgi:glycosyltransferase XagB
VFFHTRRVDWVDPDEIASYAPDRYPRIVLLYPVLRELEETMRTTFRGLAKLDYPTDRYRIVAIPNADDLDTIASLERLCSEFSNIEILRVPPTTDASWDVVWDAWDANPKAYWWHTGRRAGERALPPKKTRQLVYAFYTIALQEQAEDDWLLNYIDADSVPPTDHFRAGAAGIERFDVVQSTNVAGNLLDTWASSWHAMDHMCWDGHKYPHLSAGGAQPFWVLGKGLFYKASDLLEVGSFHPWLTIEDPEIGMRLWINGKRIGIVASPLIEEVPVSLREGVRQRKRWVCGFLQSLHTPLRAMGMTWRQRVRARLNMWPCMFLMVNAVGLPLGIWALVVSLMGSGSSPLPTGFLVLGVVNVSVFSVSLFFTYRSTWRRTALVLDRRSRRLRYMLRVNPVFLMLYWVWWTVPLLIGINMFLRDRGLVWERTRKIDANHDLVRARMRREATAATGAVGGNGLEPALAALPAARNGNHPANGGRVVRVRAPRGWDSAQRNRRSKPDGAVRLVALLNEVAATRAREAAERVPV